jgi:hypothetical protein
MAEITLVTLLLGLLSGALASVGFYFANKYVPNTEINKIAVVSYMIVGAGIGVVESYLGLTITYELIAVQVVANAGIVAIIDMILSGIFQPQAATYVVRYTGRTFYPEFTLTQNNGDVQVFNTASTGRSVSVTAYRDAGVARAIGRRMLSTVSWSPGFTVTPSYTEGNSPVTVTLKMITGRNPDLTAIKNLVVDWKDGSPIETVALALNSDQNPEGSATHSYAYYP